MGEDERRKSELARILVQSSVDGLVAIDRDLPSPHDGGG